MTFSPQIMELMDRAVPVVSTIIAREYFNSAVLYARNSLRHYSCGDR